MPTPAPSPSSRYSLLNRADHVPPCEPRSVRGWSGALLNDDQSLLTLKGVQGALCQTRCPEKVKEPIENQSFIASPCIVSSSNVCTLQECDNKQPAKIPFSTIWFRNYINTIEIVSGSTFSIPEKFGTIIGRQMSYKHCFEL